MNAHTRARAHSDRDTHCARMGAPLIGSDTELLQIVCPNSSSCQTMLRLSSGCSSVVMLMSNFRINVLGLVQVTRGCLVFRPLRFCQPIIIHPVYVVSSDSFPNFGAFSRHSECRRRCGCLCQECYPAECCRWCALKSSIFTGVFFFVLLWDNVLCFI